MGKLDLKLFTIFGTLALVSLVGAGLCFRQALRVSGERDGDVKMFFWAAGSMLGLIIAGACAGYILLPIILHS